MEQPVVLSGEVAVLVMRGRPGTLRQAAPQPSVPPADLAVTLFARGLVIARRDGRPAAKLLRGRKRVHVHASLGKDRSRRQPINQAGTMDGAAAFRSEEHT